MTRKALIIVGFAALIAATGGAALASNTVPPKETASVASVTEPEQLNESSDAEQGYDSADISYDEYSEDAQNPTEAEINSSSDDDILMTEADSDSGDEDQESEKDKHLTADFRIDHVLNYNNGEQVQPQVAFGKYFRQCYLKLYDDSSVELCLNPTTDKIESGYFTVEDDSLNVDYGNERSSSFKILYDDENNIDTIIVTSRQYIVYFR